MSKKIGGDLFKTTDTNLWKLAVKCYPDILKAYSKKKKKDELIELDNWMQNSLRDEICKRKNGVFLEKEELVKLMKWKLTRGKFRPRLTEMVKSNTAEMIKEVSTKSFDKTDTPKEAINELCKLKAVGPATASAILTAYCPDKYAFMADEAVVSVLTGKIDYTLKYYLKYLELIQEKAKELSKKDNITWTPHDVELALWTSKVSQKLDIDIEDLDEKIDEKTKTSKKRKSEDSENEESKSIKKRKQ